MNNNNKNNIVENSELNSKSNRTQIYDEIKNKSYKILQLLIGIYFFLILISVALNIFVTKNFFKIIQIPLNLKDILFLLAVSCLASILLLIQNYFFEDWFEGIKKFKNFLMMIIGPTNAVYAIALSVVSAVGEELFFRAFLQPLVGIFFTSVIFGILHPEPYSNKIISSCSVWAFIAGLVLGWLVEATGNIWPSIIVHFIVNLVGMLRLQRSYRNAIKL